LRELLLLQLLKMELLWVGRHRRHTHRGRRIRSSRGGRGGSARRLVSPMLIARGPRSSLSGGTRRKTRDWRRAKRVQPRLPQVWRKKPRAVPSATDLAGLALERVGEMRTRHRRQRVKMRAARSRCR
jgi:hypothetical protein